MLDVAGRISSNYSSGRGAILVGNSDGTGHALAGAGGNGEWSSSATTGDLILRSTNGTKLILQNGSGTAGLTLNSNNVGIGTTSPAQKLHIGTSSSSLTYNLELQNSGAAPVGLLFSTEGSYQYGKGGLVYTRDNSYARGAFHFLQDSGADSNNPDLADSVMTILNSGNVGIGTTNPSSQLTISKSGAGTQISVESAVDNAGTRGGFVTDKYRGTITSPTIVQNNDSIGFMGFRAYDGSNLQLPALLEAFVDGTPSTGSVPARLSFVTGSNSGNRQERLTVKNDGNVGIGTTNPQSPLHIFRAGGSPQVTASNYSGIGNGIAGYNIRLDTTNLWQIITQNTGGGLDNQLYLQYLDNSANRFFTLSTSGKLGLGTTAPSKTLDIVGDLNLTGTIFTAGTSGTSGQILSSTGTGLQWINASGVGQTYSVTNGLSSIATNVFGLGGTLTQNTTIGTSSFSLSFLGLGNTQSLYLDTTGRVGIGQTTFLAGSSQLQIYNNGTTPSITLVGGHDSGEDYLYFRHHNSQPVGKTAIISKATGTWGRANLLFALSSSSDHASVTSADTKMAILNSGNVGIGTTNPAAKLEIVGSSDAVQLLARGNSGSQNSNIFAIQNSSSTDLFTVGNGGNAFVFNSLSIGNTSTSEKLVVNGNIKLLVDTDNKGLFADDSPQNGSKMFSLTRQSNNLSITSYDGIGFAANKTGGPSTSYDMFIDNGFVGLGTTSPTKKLDVIGDGSFSTNLSVGGTLTLSQGASTGYILTSDASGNSYWAPNTGTGTTYAVTNGLTTIGSPQIFGLGGTLTQNTEVGTSSFNLSFLGMGNTQGLYLASSGKVGIGNTSPLAKFQVSGNSYFTSQVGIGITPTSALLNIAGVDNSEHLRLTFSPSPDAYSLRVRQSVTANNVRWIFDQNNVGTSYPAALTFMAGKIGIGNSEPDYKLHVTGDALISTRLGIGATNPLYTLNVGNTARTTDQYISGNLSIGTTYLNSNYHKFRVDDTVAISSAGVFNHINNVTTFTGNYEPAQLVLANTDNTPNNWVKFYMGNRTDTGVPASAIATQITGHSNNTGLMTFSTNSSGTLYERMRILSNGNVGIGTTNPQDKLEVNGKMRASLYLSGAGTLSDPAFSFTGDPDTGIYQPSLGALSFTNNGAENLRLTSTGNLGLGTTAPGSILTIGSVGATATGGNITVYNTLANGRRMPSLYLDQAVIKFDSAGGGHGLIFDNGYSSDNSAFIDFRTNGGTSAMRLLGSGNLGLGTTDPSKKLDVIGDGSFSTNLSVGGTLTLSQGASNGYILTSDSSGNSYWAPNTGTGTTYAVTNGLTTIGSPQIFGLGGTLTQNTTIGTSSFNLSFLGLGNTQSLYLASSGYVGIGTTSTSALFNLGLTGSNTVGQLIKAGIGQTTNLSEWRSSSDVLLSSINNLGHFVDGDFNSSQWRNYQVTKTTGSTNGDYVEIAQITSTGGLGAMILYINAYDNNSAQIGSKAYILSHTYNAAAAWKQLAAHSTAGIVGGGNWEVDAQTVSNTDLKLRLRTTTSASSSVTFNLQLWAPSTYSIANATATGNDTSVLHPYSMFNKLMAQSNTIIGGFPNMITGGYNEYTPQLFVKSATDNGGSTPNAPEPALTLYREGISGQSWGNIADFSLSRYINSGYSAKTQMDIRLLDTSGVPSSVMTLRSSGTVGIGTTAPNYKLEVNGDALISTRLGIGATNPLYALNVGGTTSLTDVHISSRTSIGTTAPSSRYQVQIRPTANIGLGVIGGSSDYQNGIEFGESDTQAGGVYWRTTGTHRVNFTTYNNASPMEFGNNWMYLTQTGLVGLGTTAPSKKLDVIGDGSFSTNLSVGGTLTLSQGAQNGYILTADASGNSYWAPNTGTGTTYSFINGLSNNVGSTNFVGLGGTLTQNTNIGTSSFSLSFLGSGGTQGLYISNTGDVGLGTTNIENADGWNKVFDIYGTYHSKLSVRSSNVDARVLANNNTFWGSPSGMIVGTNTNNPLSFATYGSNKMTILASGNVGIGTTTPDAKLHLYNYNTDTALKIDAAGSAGTIRQPSIDFYSNYNINGSFLAGKIYATTAATGDGGSGKIIIAPTTSAVNSLTIASGKIGIFTTDPQARLHIQGAPLTSGSTNIKAERLAHFQLPIGSEHSQQADFWLGRYEETGTAARTALTLSLNHGTASPTTGADTDVMTWLSSGNIGLGTTNPSKKLDVIGDGSFSTNLSIGGTLTLSQGASNGYILTSDSSGNSYWAPNVGTGTTYSFINGLSNNIGSTNYVGLGGTLTQNTTIGTSSFSLSFLGLGNTQGLYLASSGYVGIGNTNPGKTLDITGTLRASGYLTANGGLETTYAGIGWAGNSNYALLVQSSNANFPAALIRGTTGQVADILKVGDSNNTPFFTVGTTNTFIAGNLGIGLSNPATKLHIAPNSGGNELTVGDDLGVNWGTSATIMQVGNTNGSNASIVFGESNTATGYLSWLAADNRTVLGSGGNTSLGFHTMNTERLTVTGSGNIGIGTTDPWSGAALDIVGNVRISGSAYVNTINNDAYNNINLDPNTGTILNSGTNLYLSLDANNDGTTSAFIIQANANTRGAGTELFRINESGSVGLGTTSPTKKLDVIGDGSFSTNLSVGGTLTLSQGASTGYILTSDSSGNSYWAPNTGTGTTYAVTNGLTTIGSPQIFGLGGTLTQNTTIGTSSFNLSFLAIGNSQSLFLKSNGYVGIGTANPSYQLDVGAEKIRAGTIYASAFQDLTPTFQFQTGGLSVNSNGLFNWSNSTTYANSTKDTGISRGGAAKIYIGNGTQGDSSGTLVAANLGVGTTAPNYKLEVIGDARISTSLTVGTSASVLDNLSVGGTASLTNLNLGNLGLGSSYVLTSTSGASGGLVGYLDTSTWDKNAADDIAGLTAGVGITISSSGSNYTVAFNPASTSNLIWNSNSGSTWAWTFDTAGIDPRLEFNSNSLNLAAGYFGIGQTSPVIPLDVGASSTLNSVAISARFLSGVSATRFYGNGNGHPDPEVFLDIGNASYQSSSLSLTASGSIKFDSYFRDVGTTGWYRQINDYAPGKIENNKNGLLLTTATTDLQDTAINWNSAQLFLNQNGYVGIGTTDPKYQLEVAGDALISSRLGVGATSASYELNVNGAGNFTTSLTVGTTTTTGSLSLGTLGLGSSYVLTSASGSGGGSVGYLDTTGWDKSGTDDLITLNAGIGITITGTGNSRDIAFDATDFGTTTWGSGSTFTWTFDTGTSDPVLSLANNFLRLSSGQLEIGTSITITQSAFQGKTADSVNEPSFTWEDDTNTGIFHPASAQIAVGTSGVERLRVSASGNVGIGDSNPSALLSLAGSLLFHNNVSGTGVMIADGGNYNSGMMFDQSSNKIIFRYTNNSATWNPANVTDVMTIYSQTGKVGIGTTNPDTKLHLDNGSLKIASNGEKIALYESDVGETQSYTKLSNASSTNNIYIPYLLMKGNPSSTGYATLFESKTLTDSPTDTGVVMNFRVSNGANDAVPTALANRPAYRFQNYSTDLMTIDAAGEVGIGTTDPSSKLHVVGNGYFSTNLSVGNSLSVGSNLSLSGKVDLIGNAGFLDVGPSNPDYGLVIRNYANQNWSRFRTVDVGNTMLEISVNNTSGLASLALLKNGYVGIGTTNPSYNLHVAGEIFSSTRIGIGATSTAYELNVVGDGYFSNNLAIGSTITVPSISTTNNILLTGGDKGIESTTGFIDLIPNDTNYGLVLRDYTGTSSAYTNFRTVGVGNTRLEIIVANSTPTTGISLLKSGYLGIGTTSPSNKLFITSDDTAEAELVIGDLEIMDTYNTRTAIQVQNSNGISEVMLGVNSSEYVNYAYVPSSFAAIGTVGSTIPLVLQNAGGYVAIGKGFTSPSVELDVSGSIEYTGTITDVSDRRLKENFETLNDPLNALRQITGLKFNMVGSSKKEVGVIAQDVQTVLPEAVSIIDSEGHLGVSYVSLVPLTIEGIKTLDTQIQDITHQLTDLSLTQTGEVNINYQINEGVLAYLGYDDTKTQLQSADYNLQDQFGHTVTRLAQFSEVAVAKVKSGLINTTNLIAKNAVIDNLLAQKSQVQKLETNIISPLSGSTQPISINGDVSLNGDLTALSASINHLQSLDLAVTSVTADNLIAKDSNIQNLESSNATISGTLYADNIISREGSFGEIMTTKIASLRQEIQNLISSSSTSSATQAIASAQNLASDWYTQISSDSAQINGNLSLSDNLVIGGQLAVVGQVNLGQITIDSNLIASANNQLYLQPSGQGSVHILADTLVIADTGEVTINGSLNIRDHLAAKSASISGSLFASLLEVDDATVSGTLDIRENLTAQSASIRDNLSTSKLIIATDTLAPVSTSSSQLASNATAGTVTLAAGSTQVVIENPHLTASSMVYLTPVGSTKNQVVYLKDKTISPTPEASSSSPITDHQSQFTIAIDQPLDQDIQVNWWIIN
jgi:hypothetical protein